MAFLQQHPQGCSCLCSACVAGAAYRASCPGGATCAWQRVGLCVSGLRFNRLLCMLASLLEIMLDNLLKWHMLWASRMSPGQFQTAVQSHHQDDGNASFKHFWAASWLAVTRATTRCLHMIRTDSVIYCFIQCFIVPACLQ